MLERNSERIEPGHEQVPQQAQLALADIITASQISRATRVNYLLITFAELLIE